MAAKQNRLSASAVTRSQRLRRSQPKSRRKPSSKTIRPMERSTSSLASSSASAERRLLACGPSSTPARTRSEEHTSELQSQSNLVCRLLLEKKKKKKNKKINDNNNIKVRRNIEYKTDS